MDILSIIVWILFGIAGFMIQAIYKMRGKEFIEYKFRSNGFNLSNFIFYCCLGVIAFIMSICMITGDKGFSFTKLLYIIANIGIKKDEDEGE